LFKAYYNEETTTPGAKMPPGVKRTAVSFKADDLGKTEDVNPT